MGPVVGMAAAGAGSAFASGILGQIGASQQHSYNQHRRCNNLYWPRKI